MPLTNAEFEAILANPSKQIAGDLAWSEDEDHSPSVEFRAEVQSAVWQQFCRESGITHHGNLSAPPPLQKDLFL